jgi:hypothetical protein
MFNSNKLQQSEKNHQTITHLKFISTFEPGDKINISTLQIEKNTLLNSIKRYWYGESRNTTLNFITTTIEQSFQIVLTLLNSDNISDKMLCSSITIDLKKCINGLKNLQQTYSDDKLFFCTIDTIIDNIDAKISEIKFKKPELCKLIDPQPTPQTNHQSQPQIEQSQSESTQNNTQNTNSTQGKKNKN